jgi:hypothetical protein
MAKLKGKDEVKALLASTSKRGRSCQVKVGYATSYAIYVHETPPPPPKGGERTAFHPVGQWKYLEQPAREEQEAMAEIVARNLKNKESLVTAMLRSGQHLQRKSQELVPVDTGALRASAYTEVTDARDAKGRFIRRS